MRNLSTDSSTQAKQSRMGVSPTMSADPDMSGKCIDLNRISQTQYKNTASMQQLAPVITTNQWMPQRIMGASSLSNLEVRHTASLPISSRNSQNQKSSRFRQGNTSIEKNKFNQKVLFNSRAFRQHKAVTIEISEPEGSRFNTMNPGKFQSPSSMS